MASTYYEKLSVEDKKRYDDKLTLANGTKLEDPFTLESGWTDDITKLPNVAWEGITKYLVESPSTFTNESRKAYKSLDGYHFFRERHVHDCFHHPSSASKSFCFIKSQVLPSQRQGKSAKLYDVWVAINNQHGWILTANCTCMAGLGSACSHIAALLFKLEAATHYKLNEEVSCTSQLCSWKASKRQVNPAPIKAINFKKGKKHDLPQANSINFATTCYSVMDPTSGEGSICKEKFKELHSINNKAAIFTSIHKEDLDIQGSSKQNWCGSDTDSAGSDAECTNNILPEPLVSLFDPTSIELDGNALQSFALKQYRQYERSFDAKTYQNLFRETKLQSLSPSWILHRAGRVTSSRCYQVAKTKVESPSTSLISQIMQYESASGSDNKFTKYGQRMESVARDFYRTSMSSCHKNLQVEETGFLVCAASPFLGASTDGLVTCFCHENRVLEIKCPYKYRSGFEGWQNDKDFPLAPNKAMKKGHRYFYQIQLQMFIYDVQSCDFLVYTPSNPDSSMVVNVLQDKEFLQSLFSNLQTKFEKILLPEIVSRAKDTIQNDRKVYCTCQRPEFGQMIACDGVNCTGEWFHYPCVQITRAPKGSWFCRQCRREKDKNTATVRDSF